MEVLRLIANRAYKKLDYMVIDGHAVNARKVARQTKDIDLLIRERDVEAWTQLMERFGYRITNRGAPFIQLTYKDIGEWPIDLMFVDEHTFDVMYRDSQLLLIGGNAEAQVPSVQHLAALKLHAIKNAPHRELQDLADIVKMIVVNKIDYKSESFRESCIRHGNQDLYEKIVEHCQRSK